MITFDIPSRKQVLVISFKTVLAYAVFIISLFSVPLYNKTKEAFSEFRNVSNTALVIGESILNIEIADSPEERKKGLSGRDSLEKDSALLFIFDEPDFHGIWMKEMNFSIDIIWLDKYKQVIDIEENVSPDTFPKIFKPGVEAMYVLETNAGFVEKNGIKINDEINLLKTR